MKRPRLVLGSASPRRQDLLTALGFELEVRPAQIDESVIPGEAPATYLARVVDGKRRAVTALVGATSEGTPSIVLVADTIVVLGQAVLGKPRDSQDALAMVRALVGQRHEVTTRYSLSNEHGHEFVARSVTTLVTMRTASLELTAAYARTGEGADKAGAYAIQGFGAMLVESIEGSYSNVVGLPLCEVTADLLAHGVRPRFLEDPP